MSDPSITLAAIARFGELAKRGAHPAASHGEQIANRLAKTLHAIGDDMAILDGEAIRGFAALCQLAGGPWPTADNKSFVFDTIRQAAMP